MSQLQNFTIHAMLLKNSYAQLISTNGHRKILRRASVHSDSTFQDILKK